MNSLTISTIVIFLTLLCIQNLACNFQDAYAQSWREYKVTYEKNTFTVRGTMSGDSMITGIQVFPEYGSLLISTDVDETVQNNTLRIVLPRQLIDSKSDGVDSKFLVIVDDEDVEYSEMRTTDTERELEIPLGENSLEVEIFGSQIVPEFSLSSVVLMSSFIFLVTVISIYRIGLSK